MKKILPFIFALLVFAGCAKNFEEDGYRKISAEEAADMMEKERDYIILDVRTYKEFESGHIPGAICVPNESISDKDIFELPDKNQLIMVYCRSGNRSRQAAEKLVNKGYTNIVEFGGINSWKGKIVC